MSNGLPPLPPGASEPHRRRRVEPLLNEPPPRYPGSGKKSRWASLHPSTRRRIIRWSSLGGKIAAAVVVCGGIIFAAITYLDWSEGFPPKFFTSSAAKQGNASEENNKTDDPAKDRAQAAQVVANDVTFVGVELASVVDSIPRWGPKPTLKGASKAGEIRLTVSPGKPLPSGKNSVKISVPVNQGTQWHEGRVSADGAWCIVLKNSGQYALVSHDGTSEESDRALSCP